MGRKANNKRQGLLTYPDGQWGIDCFIHGRRVRRKVGGLAEAKKLLLRLKAEEAEGKLALPPATKQGPQKSDYADPVNTTSGKARLKDIIESYLSVPRDEATTIYCNLWKKGYGEVFPEQLTVQVLRDYVKVALTTCKVATVHRQLDSLRAAWNDAKLSLPSPMADRRALGLADIDNERTQTLSADQEDAFLESLGKWGSYALFSLLSGIRFSNMARLEWPHIHWEEGFARLTKVKATKALSIPLSKMALEMLRGQREVVPADCPFCFPTESGAQLDRVNFRKRIWKPAMIAAGIDGTTWHDLRRTAATRMANDGIDLYTLMRCFGWTSYKTAMRYARVSDERRLEAVERLALKSKREANPAPWKRQKYTIMPVE